MISIREGIRVAPLLIAVVACRSSTRRAAGLPVTLVAGSDSGPAFGYVLSVRELPENRFLVSDLGDGKLLLWAADSDYTLSIGRVGPGPGEYLRPAQLWTLSSDSTLMLSFISHRWDVLVGDSLSGSLAPDSPVVAAAAASLGTLSLDTLGKVLMVGRGRTPSDSQVLQLVARADGMSRVVGHLGPPQEGEATPGPYPPQYSVAALAPDGWIAILQVEPYRIDWISPTGQRVFGSPIPTDRVPVDAAEKQFLVALMSPERRRFITPQTRWPRTVPPIARQSLWFSPQGDVLVERTPTRHAPTRAYDVIDHAGALVRRVEMPRSSRLIGFGLARAVIATKDANDLEHLSFAGW